VASKAQTKSATQSVHRRNRPNLLQDRLKQFSEININDCVGANTLSIQRNYRQRIIVVHYFCCYTAPMTQHDSGYHLLFSHPELAEDLLRNFVSEDWIGQLDFTNMECVNAKLHADGLDNREGDMIYS